MSESPSHQEEIKLTISREKVAVGDVTKDEDIDVVNRDPKHTNDHVKVSRIEHIIYIYIFFFF